MAGTYPDLPAPRIEYDRDGTRFYRVESNTVSEFGAGSAANLNDENRGTDIGYADYGQFGILLVFPELRDITHMFMEIYRNGADSTQKVEWSNDSTNGIDGTWTVAIADFPESIDTTTRYRSDIVPVTGLIGIRMLRIIATNPYFTRMQTLHLYGTASTGQNLHRLMLWHPTLDQSLDSLPAHLDWGNVPQNSTADKQFRVKNDSPNLSASGIKVFLQALYEANPGQVSQHTLSLDGTTFVAAATPGVTLASALAAQEISTAITIRRTTLTTAQLGLWRQRIVAAADTWA